MKPGFKISYNTKSIDIYKVCNIDLKKCNTVTIKKDEIK